MSKAIPNQAKSRQWKSMEHIQEIKSSLIFF